MNLSSFSPTSTSNANTNYSWQSQAYGQLYKLANYICTLETVNTSIYIWMNEYAEICYATAHLSNGLVIEEILKVNIKSLNGAVCSHECEPESSFTSSNEGEGESRYRGISLAQWKGHGWKIFVKHGISIFSWDQRILQSKHMKTVFP